MNSNEWPTKKKRNSEKRLWKQFFLIIDTKDQGEYKNWKTSPLTSVFHYFIYLFLNVIVPYHPQFNCCLQVLYDEYDFFSSQFYRYFPLFLFLFANIRVF